MKQTLTILFIGLLFMLPLSQNMALASNGNNYQNDRKEARKYQKEIRKAARHDGIYRANSTRMKYDQDRVMRKNYKERKKMYRSSKRENRRGWDTNQLGNVMGGH